MWTPALPAPDEIVMIRPQPDSTIGLITAWTQLSTPRRFTSIGPSHSEGSISRNGFGVIDVLVALMALFKPLRIVFLWAALWAFLAAAIRPLAGESILEFVERAALWAAPLAYLFLVGFPRKLSDLFKS